MSLATVPGAALGLRVGNHSSIVIGADRLPVISDHVGGNTDLEVAKCDDPAWGNARRIAMAAPVGWHLPAGFWLFLARTDHGER